MTALPALSLFDFQPVFQGSAVEYLADRVGKSRDLLHALRHALDAGFVKSETVEQRVGETRFLAVFQVGLVGFDDRGGVLTERLGYREQRVVLACARVH